MSTPDYEAAAKQQCAHWPGSDCWKGHVDGVKAMVDAALGGDPTAWAVAALIAEGGEIAEAYVLEGFTRVDTSGLGPHLVYRIPVESAEAKET